MILFLKVPEDPNLLQYIKASLLDFSKPVCSEKSSSAPHNADDDIDPVCAKVDQHQMVDLLDLENLYSPTQEIKFNQENFNELHENINEDFNIGSPDECSNGCEQNHQMEDSFMLEDVSGVASQVQSWHFMDDDFSIQEKAAAVSSPKQGSVSHSHFKGLQEGNRTTTLSFLEPEAGDDLHYKKTLSAILGTPNWLIQSRSFHTCGYESSFTRWKKGGLPNLLRPRVQQNIFRNILFAVPLMHGRSSLMSQKENGGIQCLAKPEKVDDDRGCILPEERGEAEKFLVLRSMVPSISEVIYLTFILAFLQF